MLKLILCHSVLCGYKPGRKRINTIDLLKIHGMKKTFLTLLIAIVLVTGGFLLYIYSGVTFFPPLPVSA
jgi:hypothetical protein